MERMKLKKLLEHIPSHTLKGSKEIDITGISSHSKRVAPGHLFIAKKGAAHHIPEAIQAGAVAILTDLYNPFHSAAQIIHPDIALCEAKLAHAFYGNPDLYLVGITGTNGKTTTSYLVRHLLSPCGLIGTVEWNVGKHLFPAEGTTPDLVQNLKLFHDMRTSGCTSCAMEVSSHALDQGRVRGIDFDAAVFTNLTQDHLDYHCTMQQYAEAKAKLFTSLKGTAIVNADSEYAEEMLKGCKANILKYGIKNGCDVKASHIALTPQGMHFQVSYEEQEQLFTSPLIGRYNVYNLLAATAVGLCRGLTLNAIAKSLQNFSHIPGRLERVPNERSLNVFVDYAHTDDALHSVLTTLQELKRGRLITVFGCGGNRDPLKRPKMGAVVEAFADVPIVTSDNPRNEDPEEIIRGIITGFKRPGNALVIVDRRLAIFRAIEMATPDDIVLIAGKGHENTQTFSQGAIAFDDKAVALEAMTI